MSAMPGRLQSAFTAGELDESLHDRNLKYNATGAAYMRNVVVIPQGGFTLAPGLRHIGAVSNAAERLFPFTASNGISYDLVIRTDGYFEAWRDSLLQTVAFPIGSEKLAELTVAQQLDTMLCFQASIKPKRIRHYGASDWRVDDAPFTGIPRYDYGEAYVNGVPAKWRLEFKALVADETVFKITLSNLDTVSINFHEDRTLLASVIDTALSDMPNLKPGYTVTVGPSDTIDITFSGAENIGDGWAVTGVVLNKADAAILSSKVTAGLAPGEPIFSATRGYPRCGVFYQQRLLIGGFRSLPNAWMASRSGYYFDYDQRYTQANGAFLVPMDIAGGEAISAMVANLNLLLFTTRAEYWLAERTLSRDVAPNHVQASRNGIKTGVPVVENEGAALYCTGDGNVLSEMRYTDVEGNFISKDISLLAAHLVKGAKDLATRPSSSSTSGNQMVVLLENGEARIVTLLRDQEVTAFARRTTDGKLLAVAGNGRSSLSLLTERDSNRYLERVEDGLLLDEAQTWTFETAQAMIPGLSRFDGREVWVIGDRDVYGPYVVHGGTVTLPAACSVVTVGTWQSPLVQTLPIPRDVGPNIVLKRKARIHTVWLSLIDTTSIAISANGGPLKNIDLSKYGAALADVGELDQAFTGTIKIIDLKGFADEPNIAVGQVRPGRLTCRSITASAKL